MSTVKEVTTAVRQVAAHEARFAVLTERIDEMREHLDQAGLRLQAAEAQVQAGGNMSGFVKLTLSKEMTPDSFNGTDRMKFSDWESETSNFLSARDYEHAEDILKWIAQEPEDVAEDKFDRIAVQRGWAGQARDHARFAKYLFTVLQPYRWDVASFGEKRTAPRRSERLEKAAHGTCAGDQRDGTRIHEEVPGHSSSKNSLRCEQRDADVRRTGAEVRRSRRQEVRQ